MYNIIVYAFGNKRNNKNKKNNKNEDKVPKDILLHRIRVVLCLIYLQDIPSTKKNEGKKMLITNEQRRVNEKES